MSKGNPGKRRYHGDMAPSSRLRGRSGDVVAIQREIAARSKKTRVTIGRLLLGPPELPGLAESLVTMARDIGLLTSTRLISPLAIRYTCSRDQTGAKRILNDILSPADNADGDHFSVNNFECTALGMDDWPSRQVTRFGIVLNINGGMLPKERAHVRSLCHEGNDDEYEMHVPLLDASGSRLVYFMDETQAIRESVAGMPLRFSKLCLVPGSESS